MTKRKARKKKKLSDAEWAALQLAAMRQMGYPGRCSGWGRR